LIGVGCAQCLFKLVHDQDDGPGRILLLQQLQAGNIIRLWLCSPDLPDLTPDILNDVLKNCYIQNQISTLLQAGDHPGPDERGLPASGEPIYHHDRVSLNLVHQQLNFPMTSKERIFIFNVIWTQPGESSDQSWRGW
jgi:hypothetical protein